MSSDRGRLPAACLLGLFRLRTPRRSRPADHPAQSGSLQTATRCGQVKGIGSSVDAPSPERKTLGYQMDHTCIRRTGTGPPSSHRAPSRCSRPSPAARIAPTIIRARLPRKRPNSTYDRTQRVLCAPVATLNTTARTRNTIGGSSQRFAAISVSEPTGPYSGNHVQKRDV
jgi:hypothetical protein